MASPVIGDIAILHHVRIWLELFTGNTEEAERRLTHLRNRALHTEDPSDPSRAATAVSLTTAAALTGDRTDIPLAVTLAEAAVASPFLAPVYASAAWNARALAAYVMHDVEIAQRLRRDTGLFVPGAGEGTFLADASLGLLALVVGQSREAIQELRASRERTRHRVAAHCWTTYELGRVLSEGGSAGERDEGTSLLHEALALAQKHGLPPVESRVRECLKRLEPAAVSDRAAGLTEREVEILRLLAAGKTDKEIAYTLHITAKTASNHVGNILRKVGAGNRTEAARFATRHRLAE